MDSGSLSPASQLIAALVFILLPMGGVFVFAGFLPLIAEYRLKRRDGRLAGKLAAAFPGGEFIEILLVLLYGFSKQNENKTTMWLLGIGLLLCGLAAGITFLVWGTGTPN